ncbi:hypothetical protein DCAR_0414643 [Daucus carota subsp. sativus]|uniref:Uncharacterized protein n=1 Tax=Daucus carota subsp. sativus TaxID=79200 RepID=A0AAF0WVN6_DAUCS|nr:hypothetical protein DCAR_0414642 [Daucus carota subsp. sativus]WOG95328.1 hypothetical protein DCAR_0414643 [Daucus carota subsp. sativus]
MEDPDGTLASVAQCIEQLRQSSSSAQEKEFSLKQLLELIDTHENAFSVVGSHSQAVPMLVSLLRSGSLGVKIQAATILWSLCKENELRVKCCAISTKFVAIGFYCNGSKRNADF